MNIAVVTTLNEEQTIGALIEDLRYYVDGVVVVDDTSTDDTRNVARSRGATVLGATRIGIGPCLIMGWIQAINMGANRVLQIDAGGSHDPLEAPRLLNGLDVAAVVVGSRFLFESAYLQPPYPTLKQQMRPAMSQFAAWMCNQSKLTGQQLTDWTSGYRAFSRHALLRLMQRPLLGRMHGWQISVLAETIRLNLPIVEVPITYKAGRSSFNSKVAKEAFGVWTSLFRTSGEQA